ncbi:MAG: hypothetical protein M8841_07500 [marine benthic group bacterium]|jgi:hypothetical protein|nr:hypothetical protein [Gemmatimonadota bacterium]MCL7974398.1 hypothetical protein [Gemmatimonadota bacterium]MCL7977670.1 hypothetical protein [Gemmatimonadota bacterium]
MAQLKIKRGSLLIQLYDRFRGVEDCVFATTLRPGKETTPIDSITFYGWRPEIEVRESEDGRGWTVRLIPENGELSYPESASENR